VHQTPNGPRNSSFLCLIDIYISIPNEIPKPRWENANENFRSKINLIGKQREYFDPHI